jgi:hypothetical protein
MANSFSGAGRHTFFQTKALTSEREKMKDILKKNEDLEKELKMLKEQIKQSNDSTTQPKGSGETDDSQDAGGT